MLKHYTSQEMPESVYHSQEMDEYVSGSVLWDYFNRSPAEAVYGEKKDTAALQFGSMAHMAVLEPELFEKTYARDFEAPEGCLTSDAAMKSWLKAHGVTGYSAKKGMELVAMVKKAEPEQLCFIDEQAKYQANNEGKEFIKPDIYDQLMTMRDTMSMYPGYKDMIDGAVIEGSIVGYSDLIGMPVKVKPDIWNEPVICNYKAVSSAKPDDVLRDCFKFGYFTKEYLNALIVSELTGEFPEVRILAQCKTAPYVVTGITLTPEQIEIGRVQLEQALELYKACKDAGAYIDYTQGSFIEVETPAWMLKDIVN